MLIFWFSKSIEKEKDKWEGKKKKKRIEQKHIFNATSLRCEYIKRREKKKDGKIERKYFIKCRSDEQMEGKFAEDLWEILGK